MFQGRYGKTPRVFYAPGRVNLIGDHTDYNEGFVLPFAIDRGTSVAASARRDRVVHAYSVNREEAGEFRLDQPANSQRGIWLDYVEGMVRSLAAAGVAVTGADLVISSDLPIGAGLSSSAALEVSVGLAMSALSGESPDILTLVKAAHETETAYVGTQSGMMDQYVALAGRRDCCVLLDCRSMKSRLVPLKLDGLAIVVCDTRVRRALASSGYNERRAECDEGVARIRNVLPYVRSLRDVAANELDKLKDILPETVYRRCRHVVSENERTLAAAGALAADDFRALGDLMYESHESLRVDFQVTSPELDLLVGRARTFKGVLGSRMTGGGFGGCTVTILELGAVETFYAAMDDEYASAFGSSPGFMVTRPGNGASEVTL